MNMWNIILIAIIGWFTGMTINYLADILPFKRQIAHPRCFRCSLKQPLLNYFIYPRRCPNCGLARSIRSWLTEIIVISIFILLWLFPAQHLNYYLSLVLLTLFGIVTIIDIEHHVIMHPISVVGAVIGCIIGFSIHGVSRTIIGGAAGFLIMLIFYYFGIYITRLRFHSLKISSMDEALGFGDVNLSGIVGLILGWPAILAGLVIAILSAGAASLVYLVYMLIVKRYTSNLSIPYGPFIILGAVILLYI